MRNEHTGPDKPGPTVEMFPLHDNLLHDWHDDGGVLQGVLSTM